MSSNQNVLILGGIGVAVLIFIMIQPAERPLSQSEQFMEDLKNLSKIPKSSWDPDNTPLPGQPGWEFNFNRS